MHPGRVGGSKWHTAAEAEVRYSTCDLTNVSHDVQLAVGCGIKPRLQLVECNMERTVYRGAGACRAAQQAGVSSKQRRVHLCTMRDMQSDVKQAEQGGSITCHHPCKSHATGPFSSAVPPAPLMSIVADDSTGT